MSSLPFSAIRWIQSDWNTFFSNVVFLPAKIDKSGEMQSKSTGMKQDKQSETKSQLEIVKLFQTGKTFHVSNEVSKW